MGPGGMERGWMSGRARDERGGPSVTEREGRKGEKGGEYGPGGGREWSGKEVPRRD